MQQIADWLGKLGLSEYAQRFAENDIDFTILGDLTDQDLEKIGIASLGHRRKLLRAIANLETIEKSAPAVAVAAPTARLPLDIAERRQVTVMFSDLVGSTALSARMDPEDLREVISAYQECVAEIVRRFDGFVAKYMGDGVLVYFGYPQAHEDDAERAVRAGLELIAAVAGLKTHASLQTRVGIATGVVVVGDLIGTGAAQEQAVVGETPNLAARLQGLAKPNTVVIADSTRRLLGNLFELQDLGAREVKGIAGPVQAWVALRGSSVEGRFEALHASGTQVMIGIILAYQVNQALSAAAGDYQRRGWGTKHWRRWYFWATHSRLRPVIDAARTLKRHEAGLLSYFAHRITNAGAESLNSRIQAIRVAARGYRNRNNFKTAIYFHCGGLQLYPQTHRIPG